MIFLCYHGVTNSKSKGIENFSGKHIQKKIFENQMKILKKKCKILSIDEVIYHLNKKKPFEKDSVAISFDDGFKNNFTVAVPILKKLKIPSIFYLCPGLIENYSSEMFWVDKIEACISNSRINFLKFNFKKYKFSMKVKTNYQKIIAIKKLKKLCKSVNVNNKNEIIEKIISNTKINPLNIKCKNYEIANWNLIKKSILGNKLFTIGGHSMFHDILTKINKKHVSNDIRNVISLIKKRTKIKVKHFSYPEGKQNKNIINILKKNKILSSPLAYGFKNSNKTNPFHINRVMVGFEKNRFPYK